MNFKRKTSIQLLITKILDIAFGYNGKRSDIESVKKNFCELRNKTGFRSRHSYWKLVFDWFWVWRRANQQTVVVENPRPRSKREVGTRRLLLHKPQLNELGDDCFIQRYWPCYRSGDHWDLKSWLGRISGHISQTSWGEIGKWSDPELSNFNALRFCKDSPSSLWTWQHSQCGWPRRSQLGANLRLAWLAQTF